MLRNLACLQPTPDNLVFPPKRGDYKYFEAPRPAPGGSEGLDDAPRSGRPPVLQLETIAQIVYKTTQETDRLSACHARGLSPARLKSPVLLVRRYRVHSLRHGRPNVVLHPDRLLGPADGFLGRLPRNDRHPIAIA